MQHLRTSIISPSLSRPSPAGSWARSGTAFSRSPGSPRKARPWRRLKQEQAGKVDCRHSCRSSLVFIANLIMAVMLYGIMKHVGPFTIRSGMISGALIWFGFVVTTIAVNYAFQGRKPMLTVIDARILARACCW